uniref:Uncharacterized protein n=1 Tax=Rhizophora mucronata TaxID=61149 RepID=A0A2P2Q9Q4_RHIMU
MEACISSSIVSNMNGNLLLSYDELIVFISNYPSLQRHVSVVAFTFNTFLMYVCIGRHVRLYASVNI